MVEYKITIKPSALKELEKIPKKITRQIVNKILSLAKNPCPIGTKKLSGDEKYRIRQGDYRIVYRIDEISLLVEIVKIGHRREVYRKT